MIILDLKLKIMILYCIVIMNGKFFCSQKGGIIFAIVHLNSSLNPEREYLQLLNQVIDDYCCNGKRTQGLLFH